MNKDLSNIEQDFQEVSQDLTFELDTADLWASIEPQLPPEKGNNRKPFWLMLTGILVFGALGAVWIFSNSTTAITNATTLDSPVETINPSELATNLIASSLTEDSESEVTSTNDFIDQNNKNTDLNSPKPIQNNSRIERQNITQRIRKSIESKSHSQPLDIVYIDRLKHHDKSNSELGISQSQIAPPIILKPIVQDNFGIISEDKRETLSLINPVNTLMVKSIFTDNDLDLKLPFIEPIKPTSWESIYMLNVGISYPDFDLSSKNAEGADLSNFNNEKALIGLNMNLGNGRENSKGCRWFVGLSYDRITTRYSLSNTIETQGTISGNESYRIDDEGNIINTPGELNTTTVTNYDVRWHRNHQYLNLQAGLGKRLLQKGRWSLSSDVVIGYNVWSSHDGYYFEEGQPSITKFESNEVNPYQNQGMQLGGRMTLGYQIGKVTVGLSPYANTALNNTTKATNYYQIKNSQYGIQLGVMYRP